MKFKKIIVIFTLITFLLPKVAFTENIQWLLANKNKNYNLKTAQISLDTDLSHDKESINITIDKNSTINTKVNFQNTGNTDVYMRVLIIPIIEDLNDNTYIGKVNLESIKFNYFNEDPKVIDENYWHLSEDGYIYYKNIFKEGEYLEDKLLESISINFSQEELEYYKNKNLRIDLVVEVVQAKHGSFEDAWKIENL